MADADSARANSGANMTNRDNPFVQPARLGWRLEIDPFAPATVCFDAESFVQFVPDLPGLRSDDPELVLDLRALLASAKSPGGFQPITCGCGDSSHAGVNQLAFVSHPTASTIRWHLDTQAYAEVLQLEVVGSRAYWVLEFDRPQYEQAICDMWQALQVATSDRHVLHLQPGEDGTIVELQTAMGISETFARRALFAPGSTLELDLQVPGLHRLNGQTSQWWPYHLIPDHTCFAAFQAWVNYVDRGWAFKPSLQPSEAYFLHRESDRVDCDLAGAYFAALLQAAWAASMPPQLLEVRCLPCRIPAAEGIKP